MAVRVADLRAKQGWQFYPTEKGGTSLRAVTQVLMDRIPETPVDLAEARRALRAEPLPDSGGDSKKNKKAARKNHKLRRALKVMRWSHFDTIRREGWLNRTELGSSANM